MDIAGIVNIILPIVFCLVGVALIVFLIELVKVLKTTRNTVENLGPTLKNVEDITTNIQPTLAKVDPIMDRVQLTLDSVNLEMMRVDQILEDVAEISDTASTATAAVGDITNAPLKAVNSVTDRFRHAFGKKDASDESAQLAEQRVAVAQALEEYKEAEVKDAKAAAKAARSAQIEEAAPAHAAEAAPSTDAPKSYVKESSDGTEPVIDPKVIAESSFFDEGPDAK